MSKNIIVFIHRYHIVTRLKKLEVVIPSLPLGLAFLEEGGDSLLGIPMLQILHHHILSHAIRKKDEILLRVILKLLIIDY